MKAPGEDLSELFFCIFLPVNPDAGKRQKRNCVRQLELNFFAPAMKIEKNQYFNVEEFSRKIRERGFTAAELLEIISQEIYRVEQLKIALVDDQIKENPDAVVQLTNEIDTYVMSLQEILTRVPADSDEKRVLNSDELRVLRDKIEELLKRYN